MPADAEREETGRHVPAAVPGRARQGARPPLQRKADAHRWLDEVTAAVHTGTYVDPARAKLTMGELAAVWLPGISTSSPPPEAALRTSCACRSCRVGVMSRYADLFDDDPDEVADRLDALRATSRGRVAGPLRTEPIERGAPAPTHPRKPL